MKRVKINTNFFMRKYIKLFDAFSFNDIIFKYESIESSLIESAMNNIDTFLKNSGCKSKGNTSLYKKKGIVFEVKIQFIESERCLTVFFQQFKSVGTNKTLVNEIKKIGLIKTVEFHYNNSVNIDFVGLFDIICTDINTCYDVLEIAFIRNSSDFSKEIYKSLHYCFESLLKIENKHHLLEKYFFLISDEDFGYCYFDDNSIRPIIERVKSDQARFYSPLQIMIWLISSPFPFKKSISLQSKKASKEITELISNFNYIDEFPRILRGVMYGLNTDDITVKFISQVRKYNLSITFPSELKEEILPIITQQSDLLEEVFKSNMKKYSPYLKNLNSATKIINESKFSDFASSIIAKLISEMMKPM